MLEEFSKLINNYPVVFGAIAWLLIAIGIVAIILLVVAFFQGRSISFWPPRIGEQTTKKNNGISKHVHEASGDVTPYLIPSSLSFYRYGEIEDNSVELIRRRVLAVKANISGSIDVSYPVNTNADSATSALSISHPDLMQPLMGSERTKVYSIKIQAEIDRQYIVSSESTVHIKTDQIPNNPDTSDPIMATLHNDFLNRVSREFVGSRIPNAPTTHHRIIVEFSSRSVPKRIHTLQINESGKVIKDDDHSGFVLARSKDMSHAILDIYNPEPKSGVYLWWEWEY